MPTIVVLGGSLGGLGVTHRLLKYTLPHHKDLKVILVTKNSHFYWNVASVRAIVPGALKDEDLLRPIAPGLMQYPSSSIELVIGAATGIDPASKTVSVALEMDGDGDGDGDSKNTRTITYDYVVVATGANAADTSMPWKASGTHHQLLDSLHDTAARVGRAQHIVVVGAGPTGVEVAAEIRTAFPEKEVVLLCADEALVGGDSIAGCVESGLRSIGVDVRKGVRSTGTTELEGGRRIKVSLTNGESIATDLYLPTTGLVPNTGFLPADVLSERGFVRVDDCLRIEGMPDAWALGDTISRPRPAYLITEAQATSVAKNIQFALKGAKQQAAKEPPVDVFLCSLGRRRGAGRLGYVPVPSFSVWMVKSRTLGTERTPKFANGTMW